jgi:hypothetical protein
MSRKTRNLERLTKEPTILLCRGVEYKVAPLELRDLAAMEEWATAQPFRLLREKAELMRAAKMPEAAFVALTQAAEQESSTAYGRAKLFQSIEGLHQMAYLALRKHHPNIKREEVNEIIFEVGAEKMREIVDDVKDLSESELKNLGSGEETAAVLPR